MDGHDRNIGWNSAVAACGADEWQLAQYVFQQHGHDAVGLSAALGPWKVRQDVVSNDFTDVFI